MSIEISLGYPEVGGRVTNVHLKILGKFEGVIKKGIIATDFRGGTRYRWELDGATTNTYYNLVREQDETTIYFASIKDLEDCQQDEFMSKVDSHIVFEELAVKEPPATDS